MFSIGQINCNVYLWSYLQLRIFVLLKQPLGQMYRQQLSHTLILFKSICPNQNTSNRVIQQGQMCSILIYSISILCAVATDIKP